jgi:hypothetical protein
MVEIKDPEHGRGRAPHAGPLREIRADLDAAEVRCGTGAMSVEC